MKIQLALDRLSIQEAINIADKVRPYVHWIEVGTSLIKEFGIESVKEMRRAFPEKIIVADVKTFDNAHYEFEMCYKAGADVATVMGAAPIVSIETCLKVAKDFNKIVMFDLLNTSKEQLEQLTQYKEAIFCGHVSKDQQEVSNEKQSFSKLHLPEALLSGDGPKLALAGGISMETLSELSEVNPYVVIVGSNITKAKDQASAAKEIYELAMKISGGK